MFYDVSNEVHGRSYGWFIDGDPGHGGSCVGRSTYGRADGGVLGGRDLVESEDVRSDGLDDNDGGQQEDTPVLVRTLKKKQKEKNQTRRLVSYYKLV